MRFEEFADRPHSITLRGAELAGLYLALWAQEATLDEYQRCALEGIREQLYENFTIEEMEDIEQSYRLRLSYPSANR
ncbi:MAG TPA: hypothetical protein DCG47_04440 [Spirochaetaceae bacterium]|nr:hypothetical protein [Spirochaetaceae bacterium]